MTKNHSSALETERDDLSLDREYQEESTLKRAGISGEEILTAWGDPAEREPREKYPNFTVIPPLDLLGLPIGQRQVKAGGQGSMFDESTFQDREKYSCQYLVRKV